MEKLLNIENSLVVNNPKSPMDRGILAAPKMQTNAIYREISTPDIPYHHPITPNIAQNYTKIDTVKTPFGEDIHLYMLSNGQKVAIMPRTGTTIVKTFVNSGSMNETDEKRGISHFIEHNLFNGSEKLAPGQVFQEISKMGADTNASTNFAQTDYYISLATMDDEELSRTIEIQADMLLRPKFLDEMIEKEKGPVTSEISMVNDNIEGRAINKTIKNLFQINSASDDLVAGSRQTVSALTRDDVVDYYKRHYTPDNLTTVVVGDVDPNKTMELIAKNFNSKAVANADDMRTTEKLTPIDQPVRVDYISPKNNYGVVFGSFAGPNCDSTKENIATTALGLLLLGSSNSRLTKGLQQINAYGDFSSEKIGLKKGDPQALTFSIETRPNQEQTAINMLYDVIEEVKVQPPTAEEMTIIKNWMNKSLHRDYQYSEAVCDLIGTSIIDGDVNNIEQYENMINSLTPQDISGIAQKYLDLNKISLGVVHANNTTQQRIMQDYNSAKRTQGTAAQVSFGSNSIKNVAAQVSFGAKELDTNDVKELKLKDNSYLAINDTQGGISYFKWKLTSFATVPKNPAASYVLAEILNSGSAKRGKEQFKKDAELKGIRSEFDANSFSISAAADCLTKDSLETISMLKEVMLNPRLGQQEFDLAKQKIGNYLAGLNKSASESLIAQLYPEFFPDAPQIIKGLETLTLQDVREHYNNLIQNASSNFTITAPISTTPGLEDALAGKVAANTHIYQNPQTRLNQIYQPTKNSKILLQTDERNQAIIYKTHSFKMSGNIEDEVKFELLNQILGGGPNSRLFQDLREKEKLAYRVSSEIQNFADTGILTFYISTTTDDKEQNEVNYSNLQKSIDGFNKHSEMLKTQQVSEKELQDAKKTLKQNLFKEMELPSSETELLAMNAELPFGIKRIDEYYKLIDKITVADIQQAANHIFANKPVYSILASADTINDQTPYLNTLGSVLKLN